MKGKLLETVMDLNETTEYKVNGWGRDEGIVDPSKGSARGLLYFSYPL